MHEHNTASIGSEYHSYTQRTNAHSGKRWHAGPGKSGVKSVI